MATLSDLMRPGARVKDAAAFEEMRQHILTLYPQAYDGDSAPRRSAAIFPLK